MTISPELISQIVIGLLLAAGTFGVRWSTSGRKRARRVRRLEEKLEIAITFIYQQRDDARLINDLHFPPTPEDPDGTRNRIKIREIPKELKVVDEDEDDE